MNHFLLSILDYEGRELKGVYNLAMLLVCRVGMSHFLLSILDYEGRELKGVYNLTCC